LSKVSGAADKQHRLGRKQLPTYANNKQYISKQSQSKRKRLKVLPVHRVSSGTRTASMGTATILAMGRFGGGEFVRKFGAQT
jgi:hypothetical protein